MENEDILKKRSRECRDIEAGVYDRSFSAYALAVEMPTTLRRFRFSPNDRVLDAGSGTGRFTVELIPRCGMVVAIDFSFRSLEVCRQRIANTCGAKVYLLQADLCYLPFKPEVFDKVGSSQVLQDLPSPQSREGALREMSRVVKRNGNVVITTFNYPFTERLRLTDYAGEKEGFHHKGHAIYYYRFNYYEFKKIVSKLFKIEELCGIRNIPGKPIGEWFRKKGMLGLATSVDFLLEKTILSRITGRFLLAKLRKK